MIFPGRLPATMLRAAAWHVRNVPRRLISITRSHSSTSMSRTARVGKTPALATAMSRVLSQSCALFPTAHMMVGGGTGEPQNGRFQRQSF